MSKLRREACRLVSRLDEFLERYEDDGEPVDVRYGKLRRLLQRAEIRLYRRSRDNGDYATNSATSQRSNYRLATNHAAGQA
jgi:hypothetical protein